MYLFIIAILTSAAEFKMLCASQAVLYTTAMTECFSYRIVRQVLGLHQLRRTRQRALLQKLPRKEIRTERIRFWRRRWMPEHRHRRTSLQRVRYNNNIIFVCIIMTNDQVDHSLKNGWISTKRFFLRVVVTILFRGGSRRSRLMVEMVVFPQPRLGKFLFLCST